MEKQEVTLGSGDLYVLPFESNIPSDSEIESQENKIGGIKGGASVIYKPNIYAVKDDKGVVHKVFITDTEVTLKTGILTWNLEVLNKIALAGKYIKSSTKIILKLGQRGVLTNYIVRFVHQMDDGRKFRVTIVGTCQNGFELTFDPEKETVIDAEFVAGSLDADGTKLILEEDLGIAEAPANLETNNSENELNKDIPLELNTQKVEEKIEC